MKLCDWLKLHGKTDAWLAERVGRDRSFITKVKNGEAMPSIGVAAHIQRINDNAVTAVDFVDSAEDSAPARIEDRNHQAGIA